MLTIHNVIISFRCPNMLKDRLIEYAEKNNLHVSTVIRSACIDFMNRDYLFGQAEIQRLIRSEIDLDESRRNGVTI